MKKADIILTGKHIFDSVGEEPFAGFVAISGNRILAVGKCFDRNGYAEYIDDSTKVLDMGEKLIVPGFHDSHTHLVMAGMYQDCVNMGAAKSEEESARMLKEHWDKHPTEGWVFGFNWYHVFWDKKELPTKFTLDRYFPDQPVFLFNAEAHGVWVNSKALSIAGIGKDTEEVFGGKIERLADGEPSGFLYEAAAGLVAQYALALPPEVEAHYLKRYMDTAKVYGITALVDVQPYFGANMGNLSVYKGLEDSGELTVRIHAAANLLGDLDEAERNCEQYRSDKVRANLLKQFVDGVITTHTALLLEDYADAPGNRGFQLCPLDDIAEAVLDAHKRGLSIKLHAIGDRAIRFCLDSYEAAIQKYGKNKARHAIEHIELISEQDIPRFKELGIVPSMQPEHVGLFPTWEGEEYIEKLGEPRVSTVFREKTLLETAGVLAVGSDCPVVSNNPFFEIHRGITRLHDDCLPEGGWVPSEKLTVAEVIRGYTYGSAYGVSREDELGTLEPGKFADIAVVDRNLFAVTPDEIRSAQVDMTIMDGKIIYQR